MQIVVHESYQHFIPTGFGWLEGFHGLGHSAFALQSPFHSILNINQEIDILVMMGAEQKYSNEINEFHKRFPQCKIVMVCFGYHEWYNQIEDSISLWVEHTYSHKASLEQFVKRNLKFANVPLAASKSKFHLLTNKNKLYDISFIGSFSHGNRDEKYYLYPLIDKGYNGFFSGFKFNGVEFPNIQHVYLNEIYNSTKVNLNFHYPNQKTESSEDPDSRIDFNGRIFEIPMSGNFQICDTPHIQDYYFGDSIVVADKKDWVDVIDYYIKNENERIIKSIRAHEIALKYHTWECRMSDVINLLNT